MKKPLTRSIVDSALLLSVPIILLAYVSFYIAVTKDIKIAGEVNLSDLFSNALNIVALYATIFFVLQLTSEVSASSKEVDIEKALVLDRLKLLYEKVDQFHEKVETGTLDFQETSLAFNRLERLHNAIVAIISSAESPIGVDYNMLLNYNVVFMADLDNCRDVLTYTPPRSSTTIPTNPLISITNNVISVTANGIQKSTVYLEKIKASIDKLLLNVNRS